MIMRLVRTTTLGEYPTYALLYSDGTMLKDMNLSKSKYAWQRECRDRDVYAVYDFITNCNHPEQLSANKYSKLDNKIPTPLNDDREGKRLLSSITRWDITSDGEKLDDIASWGGNRVTDMIVLDDDNHLIIKNENVMISCLQAKATCVDDNFVPEANALHTSAPLKMRLVKTGESLRDGMYLLYQDGTMDSTISVSETNPDALAKLRDILNAYSNGVPCTSVTGERWDSYCKDMACWGGTDAVNEILITGDGKIMIFDPSLLLTMRMQRTTVAENNQSRPEYITLRQYCDVCLKLGMYDDKFREGKKPIDMQDPDALQERMRVEYIRMLGIAKKSVARDNCEDDGYAESWKGFPRGAVTATARIKDDDAKGRNTYFIKIYYPDATNADDAKWYITNGGDGVNPCLPRYPYLISSESEYEPVLLDNDTWQWLLAELKKQNAPSTNDIQSYVRIDHIYQDSRNYNDRISKYKAEGKTLRETVDIIYADKQKNKEFDAEKREKINASVERRWGKIKERRTDILNAACKCDSASQISDMTGYTQDYVLQILSEAVNNARFAIPDNERDLQTGAEVYDALSMVLREELAEYERKTIEAYYNKGAQNVDTIARMTKIDANTILKVISGMAR